MNTIPNSKGFAPNVKLFECELEITCSVVSRNIVAIANFWRVCIPFCGRYCATDPSLRPRPARYRGAVFHAILRGGEVGGVDLRDDLLERRAIGQAREFGGEGG